MYSGYGIHKKRRRQNANINITPMVDVMLVLLIIFMVTAPLLTIGVPVQLPRIETGNIAVQQRPVTITVQKNGALYLQQESVTEDQLMERLRAIKAASKQRRIFVRGDRDVSYGVMLKIMARVADIGFIKVSLITTPTQ